MALEWIGKAVWWYHNVHLYHIMHYGGFVSRNRIYFNSPTLSRYEMGHIARSVPHLILPSMFIFLFGLRALIVVIWHDYLPDKFARLALFSEILPVNGRSHIEFTFFLWSLVHGLYAYYVIQTRVTDFTVVSVLIVSPDTPRITPKTLDMTRDEYDQFAAERRKYFAILNLATYGLTIFASIAAFIQAYLWNLFHVNPWITSFWIVYFGLWCTYACSASYGMPAYVSIISQYICIKQRHICIRLVRAQRRLNRLNQKLASRGEPDEPHATSSLPSSSSSRLSSSRQHQATAIAIYRSVIKQNQRYVRVMREVSLYGPMISRCLNVTGSTYCFAIAYVTHLVLHITTVSPDWIFVYINIAAVHAILLSSLIVTCSTVYQSNVKMAKHMMGIFTEALQCHFFTRDQLVQLETVTMSLRINPFGFRLGNGYLVRQNSFLMIMAYSLLIFRRSHHKQY